MYSNKHNEDLITNNNYYRMLCDSTNKEKSNFATILKNQKTLVTPQNNFEGHIFKTVKQSSSCCEKTNK